MAVEVDAQAYVFNDIPDKTDDPEADLLRNMASKRQKQRDDDTLSTPVKPVADTSRSVPSEVRKPFSYNPLHDLESIWWIAVYFVVNKETGLAIRKRPISGEAESVNYAHLTEDQRKYARSLFHDFGVRLMAIRSTGATPFDDHLRSLPSHLSHIAEKLIYLRKKLCTRYKEVEQPGFVIDKTVCGSLYTLFDEAFEEIVGALSEEDVFVAPLKPDPRQETLKDIRDAQRAAEDDISLRPTKRRKLQVDTTATIDTSAAPAATIQRKAAKPKKAGTTTSVPSSSTRVTRSRTRAADLEEQDDTTGVVSESSPTRAARSTSRAGRSRKRAVDPEGKADVASSPRKATKSRTRTTRGKETEDTTTIVASSSTRVTRSRTRTRAVVEDPEDDTERTGKAVVGRASSSKRRR